jgi:hypothetical protein
MPAETTRPGTGETVPLRAGKEFVEVDAAMDLIGR